MDQPEQATLDQAIVCARRLLDELLRQQAEVEANPPDLPAAQLAEGRQALANAIAAARRMIQSLNIAGQIGSGEN